VQLTGVTGWPVAHSRSPALHQAAFDSLGLSDWASQLLPIPPELFDETIRALPANGFVGVNVTIPHKEAALRLADEASEEAKSIGAANTLTFLENGVIAADNTDAPAIRSIVEESGPADLGSATSLVLGAGGSARAAVHALLAAGLGSVSVWNRNRARAEGLAADFASLEVAEAVEAADVIINTTPVGLSPDATPSDLGLEVGFPEGIDLFVDLVYAAEETDLVRLARDSGARCVDGLEVLVRQGALSLEVWTGRRPDLQVLREAVLDT